MCVCVCAESQRTADLAAHKVQITYTNEQTPITDMRDAIQKGSFFPKPTDDTVVGNAEGQCGQVMLPDRAVSHRGALYRGCTGW